MTRRSWVPGTGAGNTPVEAFVGVRDNERYGVSGAQILARAGERKLVGGQEDQLIDIALRLQREAG